MCPGNMQSSWLAKEYYLIHAYPLPPSRMNKCEIGYGCSNIHLFPDLIYANIYANVMRIQIRIGRVAVQWGCMGSRIQFRQNRVKVGRMRTSSDSYTTILKCSKWSCGIRVATGSCGVVWGRVGSYMSRVDV